MYHGIYRVITFQYLFSLSAYTMKSLLVLLVFIELAYSQLVTYHISRSSCTEVTKARTNNCKWLQLSLNTDQQVLGGEIIAYRIQWFSGKWSGWYVPGYNDIDWKYGSCTNSKALRRVWSYFYDHNHKYIICKN